MRLEKPHAQRPVGVERMMAGASNHVHLGKRRSGGQIRQAREGSDLIGLAVDHERGDRGRRREDVVHAIVEEAVLECRGERAVGEQPRVRHDSPRKPAQRSSRQPDSAAADLREVGAQRVRGQQVAVRERSREPHVVRFVGVVEAGQVEQRQTLDPARRTHRELEREQRSKGMTHDRERGPRGELVLDEAQERFDEEPGRVVRKRLGRAAESREIGDHEPPVRRERKDAREPVAARLGDAVEDQHVRTFGRSGHDAMEVRRAALAHEAKNPRASSFILSMRSG